MGELSLRDRIRENADALSPRLRAAADFVLSQPDEVAFRSLRAVAKATSLTPPTYSRLARALGFQSYEELRDICREQVRLQRSSFADRARSMQEDAATGDPGEAFVLRQGRAAMEGVTRLLQDVDAGLLDQVADWLAEARRVYVVGNMSARPFAEYMGYMASMAFENWTVLTQTGASLGAEIAGIGRRDVVIVFAVTPCSDRSLRIAETARQSGARIVGITDTTLSPLGLIADLPLVANTDGPNFFPSYTATLVLIEAIMGRAVAEGGEKARRRIATTEAANRQAGEYRVEIGA